MSNPLEITLPKGEEPDDKLFTSLRGFLIFGRLIGVLPYQGIFSNSSTNLKFRWISFPSIFSCVIILSLFFTTTLEILRTSSAPKGNAYDIAQSIRGTWYYIWVLFIYINFIVRSKSFIKMFEAWRSTFVHFGLKDHKLNRDIIIISTTLLTSAILENSLLYMKYIVQIVNPTCALTGITEKDPVYSSVVERYYYESHNGWPKYIGYNPFLAVFGFIQHKLILLAWNYMDILIALLGRALYFKFKSLNIMANITLVERLKEKPRFSNNSKELDTRLNCPTWIQMTKDHTTLCDLLDVFDNFLSPLVFVSYAVNVYYFSLQLLDGLTARQNTDSIFLKIYAPWSFIHLVLRIYILSICTARINLYAHDIRKVIYACPTERYTTEVSRLEKRVANGREIGITGLGCFTVHHPFMLSVVGVMFTFEIVLLSVMPMPDNPQDQTKLCCCPHS